MRDCGGFAPILICRKHIVGALLFALSPILLSSFCSNTVSAVSVGGCDTEYLDDDGSKHQFINGFLPNAEWHI